MALPVSLQLRYWGVAAVALGLVLGFLGDTLLPFILGGAIAYLLDPIADRMERWGLSRLLATSVITLAAVFVFVVAMLLIVPLLVQQGVIGAVNFGATCAFEPTKQVGQLEPGLSHGDVDANHSSGRSLARIRAL